MNFNKVFVGGHLVRDPEGKDIGDNMFVCNFTIGMNKKKKNGTDEVCFVEINVWGEIGKACIQELKKGSPVFVQGSLRQSKWLDRDTQKERSKITVTAENVVFSSRGGKGEEQPDVQESLDPNGLPF